MLIHVLLYKSGTEDEGIHSLEINKKTIVLMFEDQDDADRYCGLLEAQDFPSPSIEKVERIEIESFCEQAGYEARFVEKGFIPKSHEDRLLISPPESNLDVTGWNYNEQINSSNKEPYTNTKENEELDILKKRLEDLI